MIQEVKLHIETDSEGNRFVRTEVFELVEKNGILYGKYIDGPVDLELAKEVVSTRLEFQSGRVMPLIISQHNVRGLTKEARTYLSGDEAVKGISACVIIARSRYEKFLANFFLKVSVKKPPFPVRIVNTVDEAERWIEYNRY